MQQKQNTGSKQQSTLNLSQHSNVNNVSSHSNLKQAVTKTSAQTSSTTKGITHPKFLQYSVANSSKQNTTSNSGGVNTSTTASVKIKKAGHQAGQNQAN